MRVGLRKTIEKLKILYLFDENLHFIECIATCIIIYMEVIQSDSYNYSILQSEY